VNVLQVQFVLVMIHAFQLFLIDCNYPKGFIVVIVLQSVIFCFLFADFYKQAYKKKQASTVRNVIFLLIVNVIEQFKFLLHSPVTQTAVCTLPCRCGYPALSVLQHAVVQTLNME